MMASNGLKSLCTIHIFLYITMPRENSGVLQCIHRTGLVLHYCLVNHHSEEKGGLAELGSKGLLTSPSAQLRPSINI